MENYLKKNTLIIYYDLIYIKCLSLYNLVLFSNINGKGFILDLTIKLSSLHYNQARRRAL